MRSRSSGPRGSRWRGAEWEVAGDGPVREESLGMAIYDRLYTRSSDDGPPPHLARVARREFVAALSAANGGRGTWEAGWMVHRIADNGRVFVARDGIVFWDFAESIRVEGGSGEPGSACAVRVPRERRAAVPGFYVADGDAGPVIGGPGDVMIGRYYWHLRPEAAVTFLAAATTLLNAAGLPFRLKALAEPGLYRRADAGVLYLDRRDGERARPAIEEIHARVAGGLRGSPLVHEADRAGAGVRRGPGQRDELRSTSLPSDRRGALGGVRAGRDRPRRPRRAIADAFRREGLDPRGPISGPAAGRSAIPRRCPRLIPAADPVVTISVTPIEAAAIIGRSLCRSAYWDEAGSLCNWVGRSVAEVSPSGGPVTPTVSALDPGFYGGSAGIALFLARLWAATGDEGVRRTAIGAIRRSIRRLDGPATAGPLAFHSAQLGIAFAAGQIAALFDDAGLAAEADAIVERVLGAAKAPARPDVLDGLAGAIPALLAIGCDRGRALAIRLGEDLCRRALRQDGWCRVGRGGRVRPAAHRDVARGRRDRAGPAGAGRGDRPRRLP